MRIILRYFGLWLPVGIWGGLIFWLSSIPNLSSGLGTWDLILRKGAHIAEYGILAFLLWRAIIHSVKSSRVKTSFSAGILALLYAISDEFHQSFVPTRGPSVWDVLIDGIGIILVLWVIRSRVRGTTLRSSPTKSM